MRSRNDRASDEVITNQEKKYRTIRKSTIPTESVTFQDPTARLFDTLPDKRRQETDYDKLNSLGHEETYVIQSRKRIADFLFFLWILTNVQIFTESFLVFPILYLDNSPFYEFLFSMLNMLSIFCIYPFKFKN